MKEALAKHISSLVKNNDILGIGSGTTTELILKEIGKRIHSESLTVWGFCTSYRSAMIAEMEKIQVLTSLSQNKISWAFDGADEVDPDLNLLKGRGGAMYQEKLIAKKTIHDGGRLIIAVTPDKLVKKLGEKFLVPIEVIPDSLNQVIIELSHLGSEEVIVRTSSSKYGPEVTDNGNFILDVRFPEINKKLEEGIKLITGVVESGIFCSIDLEVLVAGEKEINKLTKKS